MSDTIAVRGQVVKTVSEQFGPEMAQYVEQSMATDASSPFAQMITDAMKARQLIEDGKHNEARDIIAVYRAMAEQAGIEPLFDIMMESLGIVC